MPTSKKDFVWAAEYIRMMPEDVCKDAVERAFVSFFRSTGANFNESMFRAACRPPLPKAKRGGGGANLVGNMGYYATRVGGGGSRSMRGPRRR